MNNCIETRFSQTGYRAIRNIEQLILNVINGSEYQNQLEDILSDYSEEINQYRLSTQLQTLKTKFVDSNEKTVSAVINYMKNNIGVQVDFYSEIIVLLKLYLVSPAMNAVSERSAPPMYFVKQMKREDVPLVSFVIRYFTVKDFKCRYFQKKQLANVNG